MVRPKLELVAGIPGSGKTTLASLIGERLPAPTIFKDAIKEGISLTEGARASYGGPIARRTFAAFYAVIDALVSQGCAAVAEAAAFHREWFAREVAPFKTKADLRLVVCHVPTHLAHERYRTRAESEDPRRFAHPDEVVLRKMLTNTFEWDAYDLGETRLPTLVVNAETNYCPPIEEILAFINEPPPGHGA